MTDDSMDGPGRPPFKPTKQRRHDVMLYVSCGMTEDGISAVLGISKNTLRKHFQWELANGRDVKRAETYNKAKELSNKGNVSALRLLAQMQDGGGLGAAPDLGKKEAARLAAKNPEAGTPLGDLMRRRQENVVSTTGWPSDAALGIKQ